ncbi:protein kinase domain-containing protein [Nonomuraea endophytica]|uniref:Serine/threonine protein kinase n=1 Tax=Nonomuraea endophytica TaxID=714136 RepID=A0A7W7ZY69_9ACTN|nr:protein kinase [Nonomuraea endophytica]MBB5075033.1 serine/threonine protein kinase [Nonomuraea endophytica]
MPSFSPLRPGDPEGLGPYRLLGRLGEGGQGVVYLATDPAGTEVAVKWLRSELAGDAVSIERFMREVQVAEQVAPFCTATVLAKGVENERPYIVSEFIDGPSLHRIVQEQGPRAGSALHRLAIGTATALAAIHQAGIVHRDFKPANVIIGSDGPRVIDFGIARALNATSTLTSMAVGTPSYMPPEQFMGQPVGPSADLFAWGATMVYAATGRPPFGNDTMPAVINRVLNQPPDLGALDGALREVVGACLQKDPALRPTAEQVMMRLLQHPVPSAGGMLAQGAAAATIHPQPTPYPTGPPNQSHGSQGPGSQGPFATGPGHPGQSWPAPGQSAPGQAVQGMGGQSMGGASHWGAAPTNQSGRKRRAPLLIGISIGVALLLLGGVALAVPWSQGGTTAASSTPEPSAKKRASTKSTPPADIKRTKLPGASIYLHESTTDPITLTSYEVYDKSGKNWVDYARDGLDGGFQRYGDNEETLLSPDGTMMASRGQNYTSDGYDYIVITDRAGGGRTTVKTVRRPEISSIASWSKDSKRILLNLEKKIGSNWIYLGFAVVDVASGKARLSKVSDPQVRESGYGWDAEEKGVIAVYGKDAGLRFFGPSGKAVRDLAEVGELPSGTQDVFSPDGSKFVTNCPGGDDGDHCLWNAATGTQVRKFTSACDKVLGWYDNTNLFCWEQDDAPRDEIQVVGFDGKLSRKLLDVSDDVEFSPTFTINPTRGS